MPSSYNLCNYHVVSALTVTPKLKSQTLFKALQSWPCWPRQLHLLPLSLSCSLGSNTQTFQCIWGAPSSSPPPGPLGLLFPLPGALRAPPSLNPQATRVIFLRAYIRLYTVPADNPSRAFPSSERPSAGLHLPPLLAFITFYPVSSLFVYMTYFLYGISYVYIPTRPWDSDCGWMDGKMDGWMEGGRLGEKEGEKKEGSLTLKNAKQEPEHTEIYQGPNMKFYQHNIQSFHCLHICFNQKTSMVRWEQKEL